MTAPDELPPIELLAALADGELSADDRRRAEELVSARPEVRDELDAQAAFARRAPFWKRVAVAEPSAAQYDGVLRRIRHGLSRAEPARANRRAWAVSAAAIAAALMLTLAGWTWTGSARSPKISTDSAWPVAEFNDVDVVSLLDADADLIVTGRLPLGPRPLDLAEVGDVIVEAIRPETPAGGPTQVETVTGPKTPMIVVPLNPVQPAP